MPGQETEIGRDGLPVLVQGSWSKDKLHFVSYFSSLFNVGMKNRWSKRIYVDLFAGPGICIDRKTGAEFSGSPIEALECPVPFTHLFFNDLEKKFTDALRERQKRRQPKANVEYLNLDCNQAARQIAKQIPNGSLTLAFIDPWNYELTFDGLSQLGQRPSTDLIVTFHTTAIKRNAHQKIAAVDEFFGDRNWRNLYEQSQGDKSRPPTLTLIDMFRGRLRKRLGYTQFGDPMCIRNSRGAPIFYLLFASKHPRGLDFWVKSSNKLRSGQRVLL